MEGSRTHALPPKLGIKKRKPRPSSVVHAANEAYRESSLPPVKVPAEVLQQAYVTPDSDDEDATAAPPPGLSSAANGGRTVDTSLPIHKDAESAKRKGLRHFAVRVSRKVEEKSVTTYNQVADELVLEEKLMKEQEIEAGSKLSAAVQKKLARGGSVEDEKNIRRRVYDSLNVLMAMGIIAKEKKLIKWRGLAMARNGDSRGEAIHLKSLIENQRHALNSKRTIFMELENQTTTLAALIRRNAAKSLVSVTSPAEQSAVPEERIYTPFIVVQTSADSHIELEMDEPREDANFSFSAPFAVFDDREVMRRIHIDPATVAED